MFVYLFMTSQKGGSLLLINDLTEVKMYPPFNNNRLQINKQYSNCIFRKNKQTNTSNYSPLVLVLVNRLSQSQSGLQELLLVTNK